MLEQQVTGGDEEHVECDHDLEPVAHRVERRAASAAALAFTPAISAGTKIGTARIGNSMSPPRVRPVIAESSVASAENPIAPRTRIGASRTVDPSKSRLKNNTIRITAPTSATAMKINAAASLAAYSVAGSSGLSSSPRIAPLSRS